MDGLLLGMGFEMGRKVIGSTEGLIATLDTTDERTLLGMDQHMSLEVLVPLEAPTAGKDLAKVLVAAVTAVTTAAACRGHTRGGTDRVVALDLDPLVCITIILIVVSFFVKRTILERGQETEAGGGGRADRVQGCARHEAFRHWGRASRRVGRRGQHLMEAMMCVLMLAERGGTIELHHRWVHMGGRGCGCGCR